MLAAVDARFWDRIHVLENDPKNVPENDLRIDPKIVLRINLENDLRIDLENVLRIWLWILKTAYELYTPFFLLYAPSLSQTLPQG